MILAGSQQRSGGSVATCQRTTFPSFLIRKDKLFVQVFYINDKTTNQYRTENMILYLWIIGISGSQTFWVVAPRKVSARDFLL